MELTHLEEIHMVEDIMSLKIVFVQDRPGGFNMFQPSSIVSGILW